MNALVRTVSIIAVVALPLLISTVHATTFVNTTSRAVYVGDLDLRKPEDLATLKLRIEAAARTVCGTDGKISVLETNQRNPCRAKAFARAEAFVTAALAQAAAKEAALAQR